MQKKAEAPEATSRERLLQSAEHLFAERGFDGVSVRDIADDAGANSALIGYYFRGKEGLLAEVYTRHSGPLKRERARLLAEFSAGEKSPSLEQILEAFIRPSLQAGQGSEGARTFSRMRAILSAENSQLFERLVAQNFDDTSRSFVDAFCRCLPHLRREDVLWRFHFLLGSIYYTVSGPHRIRTLSKGKCDPSDLEETTRELIVFAAEGFRAPASPPSAPRKKARRTTASPVESKGRT